MRNRANRKNGNLLFFVTAVLPPFIFMFHLYTKNAKYVNYWHILLITLVFALGGVVLYWIVDRVGKSPQAAVLVCIVFWIWFFTAKHLRRIIFFSSPLGRTYSIVMILVLVVLVSLPAFFLGQRLRRKEPFYIITVFETVIFLLNFVPATVLLATEKPSGLSDSGYTNNFTVDSNSPSPNIYWLFMDSMLGFKAMEDLFDDPQIEFESRLNKRGFLVNRNAQFEISHSTEKAIPALMSPHYYDAVMAPILTSINLNDYDSIMNSIRKLDTAKGRQNNELIFAFNAKGYQTYTIATTFGRYFYPTTTHFYVRGQRLENQNIPVFESVDLLMQIQDLTELLDNTALPSQLFNPISAFLVDKRLKMINIKQTGIDTKSIYGNFYQGGDKWHLNALSEIFAGPEPRMTIIHNVEAHYPFILNEDGTPAGRTETERLNPYNYPPQHRFTRDVLVRIIDLIIANDPDAVIVVEADHGLHSGKTREQLLAMPGGTEDKVRLMQNNTMSAVRIPEKWGGLDAPLDPLNITRVLVNRYVGENYKLLETHP